MIKSRIIDFMPEYLLKSLVIALPLFFLFGKEAEFAGQSLLLIAAALIIIASLASIALRGEIKIRRTPLDVSILIFLLITGISAAAGRPDKFSALFGNYGRFGDGWLVLLACAVLFFTAFNIFAEENEKKLISVLKNLIISGCAASALLLLALFGLLNKYLSNALAGSAAENFNLLFLFLLILTVALYFKTKKQVSAKKNASGWLYGAFALFIAALFFVNFQNFSFIKRKFTPAAELDFASAKQIALREIKSNPLLGSGTGSFATVFSEYRPSDLNQSPNWQIRFDRGYSQILEWAATIGLAGLLSYFLILGSFIYLLGAYYKKFKVNILDDDLLSGLCAGWTVLLSGQFFYSGGILLNVLFWLTLALILCKISALDNSAFKTFDFVFPNATSATVIAARADSKNEALNSKHAAKAIALILTLAVMAGLLSFVVAEVKYVYAEYRFASSFGKEAELLKAIGNNPHRLNYRLDLAKFYLNRAYGESIKPADEKNNNLIKADIDSSLANAKTALDINPQSVLANETLGMVYRDIRPLTVGSEQWSADYFKRALELEPTNPVLATELGKAYLNSNDIGSAENYLNQALELKSDYSDAKFNLAKTYAKAGRENDAIDLLLQVASISDDPEVYYELGRLHYNKGDVERAIGEFKRAIELAPNHSNSIYSLGLAYQLLGEKNKALFYFNKALELNPGNGEVMKRIEEVKK